MNRVRAAGISGLISIALVACSSSSGSSPTPSPSPTPEPTPTPGASAPASLALPSLPSNAKELEALLPDTLGGHALTKFSMNGNDFVNQQASTNAELVAWLNSLGKSLNDVSAAYAFDVTGGNAGVFAFRVNGVDHTTLLNGLQTAMASQAPDWTTTNLGGKSVKTTTESGNTEYLYGTADLIFVVFTPDQATAAEALAALP